MHGTGRQLAQRRQPGSGGRDSGMVVWEWRWASRGRDSKGQTGPAPRPAGSAHSPGQGREEEGAQHPGSYGPPQERGRRNNKAGRGKMRERWGFGQAASEAETWDES